MPERSSALGTWIKRFLLEYLPTERNLAVNTLKSYRDGLTLLLPFVAERCRKPVERLAVEDLSADRVTAFLGHLEQERGCSVQTRNLRLTAIRSFARYVAVRDAALVEWAGSIRAIPLKKTVRPRIVWLSAENMDAMIAGPDTRACSVANRVILEAQAFAPEEAPDRVPAHHDPRSGQQVPKPVDRQMRRLSDQPVNQLTMRLQEPGAVTADPARRHTPRRPLARDPLRHRGDADTEARRHLVDRLARQMGPHHALSKITRIWKVASWRGPSARSASSRPA